MTQTILPDDVLLRVENLKTYFKLREGILKAVDGVSFDVKKGKILGVIGESGCGKSITGRSIMKIVPSPGYIADGKILLKNGDSAVTDICSLSFKDDEIYRIRGGRIGMIFQEPMTSLSPVHTVGDQLTEAVYLHVTKDKKEAFDIAVSFLEKVGIGNPTQRMFVYPSQLSGGLRQRVMIAMALCANPDLLIADEPTTALDVTVQSQILTLLKCIQRETGLSILYITHDLGVIAQICHYVAVMYLGKIVECMPIAELFSRSSHPYLADLLLSIPSAKRRVERLETIRGSVPVPINLPKSCGYADRCTKAVKGLCDKRIPALSNCGNEHFVRCFLYSDAEEGEA
jgi:oligopeptide/dipeptide ABC transporter ATP-binding protein